MKSLLIPDYWRRFVDTHHLVGREIEFPWPGEEDLTAIIEILDDRGVEMEANELWPGIGIKKDGFVPVGGCSIGSGDPYCINIHDGEDGPLYVADHERVGPDGYEPKEAITVVLESYKELLNFLPKTQPA